MWKVNLNRSSCLKTASEMHLHLWHFYTQWMEVSMQCLECAEIIVKLNVTVSWAVCDWQVRAVKEAVMRRQAGGLGSRWPGTSTHLAWRCHWSLETAITWEVVNLTLHTRICSCKHVAHTTQPHSPPCLTLEGGSLLFPCVLVFLLLCPKWPMAEGCTPVSLPMLWNGAEVCVWVYVYMCVSACACVCEWGYLARTRSFKVPWNCVH